MPGDREHVRATPRRAGQVLLLLLVGSAGINLAVLNPIHNYLLDFRGYYAAGLAVRAGINPYSPAAVREHVSLTGPQRIVPYLYPPPTLGLMSVVSLLPYPAGQVPWCLFQYALLLAALWFVLRTLHCPLGSPTSVLIAFAFLTSSAVRELFRWGQFDALPLALLAATVLGLQRGRSATAGIAVGLAAVAKVTPLLGLAGLLLRGERKAVSAGVTAITVLFAGSCAALGIQIIPAWLLRLSAFGSDLATLVTPHNVSLPAFVYRALVAYPGTSGASTPWFDFGPSVARACVLVLSTGVIAVTAWWIHRTRHTVSSGECLAATIPVALLLSPVTWTHYGVQLLIPLALIIATVLRQPRLRLLDACWLLLTLMFYTNWPIEHLALTLRPWLAHLVGPTMTYATGLVWLFMLLRYASLKQTAGEEWTVFPSPASEPVLAHG